MGRCGLKGSDGQQGEDRSSVDPENRWRRFLRFTVSPDSETRIGTAAAPGVDRSCHCQNPARRISSPRRRSP
jgi:hypothetical protein